MPIELGPREWTVMEYLLIHAPKPASKDKLLQALTGWDKEITPNAVEVYISRLRGKLEPHGVALRSIRGFGYRLELTPLVRLAQGFRRRWALAPAFAAVCWSCCWSHWCCCRC
jgi:hypothetical protein